MARLSAFVFLCLFAVSPTWAATLSFAGFSQAATVPGLTIEAGRVVDGRVVLGQDSLGTSRSRGLGVIGAGDTGEADGTDQIDSYDGEDVIVFRFDRPVRLERIEFALTDWWDRFDLYIGEEALLQRTYKADDLAGYDWVSSIAVDGGPVARTFAIAASRYEFLWIRDRRGSRLLVGELRLSHHRASILRRRP